MIDPEKRPTLSSLKNSDFLNLYTCPQILSKNFLTNKPSHEYIDSMRILKAPPILVKQKSRNMDVESPKKVIKTLDIETSTPASGFFALRNSSQG
jgi:hypothetical protein